MKPRAVKRISKKSQTRFADFKLPFYLISAALLVLGIWIGIFLEDREKSTQVGDNVSQAFSIATMEVAQQFACACGSCGEKILIVCECPTAIATKHFIEEKFKKGLKQGEVVNLVKKVYGHFKG